MSNLLEVKDLNVNIADKEILKGLSISVGKGETHVIMGPNGAGKSTLGHSIMGDPRYEIQSGSILFEGEELIEMNPAERSKKGLFLTFQNPIEVPGITLANFIRSAMDQRREKKIRIWEFRKELEKVLSVLEMDSDYADRDLNVGFSGGEKKKAEILQLLMLTPKLAILDETDSGLDVDAVRVVSKGVSEFRGNTDGSLVIITHNTKILDSLDVDYTHILVDGKIVKTGDKNLISEINENGFEKYI